MISYPSKNRNVKPIIEGETTTLTIGEDSTIIEDSTTIGDSTITGEEMIIMVAISEGHKR